MPATSAISTATSSTSSASASLASCARRRRPRAGVRVTVSDRSAVTTFLFTDIEGSTRLWEQEPARMPPALARHDALARAAVERHRGIVVKMIGDGMHAAFDDPLDAVLAILELQRALADPAATDGLPLRSALRPARRRRSSDATTTSIGTAVNRAARIMGCGARRPGAACRGRWPGSSRAAARRRRAARPGRGAPARPRRAPSTSSSCCTRSCGRTSRRCARSRRRRTTCRSS